MEASREGREIGKVSSKRVASIDGVEAAAIYVERGSFDAEDNCKLDEQLKVYHLPLLFFGFSYLCLLRIKHLNGTVDFVQMKCKQIGLLFCIATYRMKCCKF
jgi:hypothetical protein